MEALQERVGDDQDRKRKKQASDKKCRDAKKQKGEETERKLETLKEKNADLEKHNSYLVGQLDMLQKDVGQTRETHRWLVQIVEGQKTVIDLLQQLLQQHPFESTFGSGQHPSFNQFGTAMGSGGSTMNESTYGLLQSLVPRGLEYGNNGEQHASTNYDNNLVFDAACLNDDGEMAVKEATT